MLFYLTQPKKLHNHNNVSSKCWFTKKYDINNEECELLLDF